MRDLIIDGFAGGGGASTGIHMALGRSPDIAINHDAVAVAMHTANHPDTEHWCQNIWKAVPSEVVKGRRVGLAWFSPDCKHFSKAKGGKPVRKNIRDLAWVVIGWAKLPRRIRPRVICVENVEEFVTWGPLDETGRPCIKRGGQTFRKWVRALQRLGYKVDYRELVAADFGSPTIRKRLFVVARLDKLPIVWPEHSHGKPDLLPVRAGKLAPWRTAAEIIDWSLPCPSIFESAEEIKAKYGLRAIRPLAENTLARVARGVKRYVIDAAEPFIVPITHTGDQRTYAMDEPLRTVTTAHRGEHALIVPSVVRTDMQSAALRNGVHNPEEPLRTVTSAGGFAVIAPLVTKFNTGATGHSVEDPLHTITACHSDHHPAGGSTFGVIAPVIVKNYHGDKPHYPVTEPTRTILTGQHHMLVAPTLINTRNGERQGQEPRVRDIAEPHPTVTALGSQGAVVAAFLAQHNTARDGQINPGRDAREPVSTIVQSGSHQAVVSAGLVNLKGSERRGASVEQPAPTQTAGGWHIAQVQAFLLKYYGADQDPRLEEPLHTATTKDRFGLCTVMIGGEPWMIVDIGMRMLTPRELFRAQGFPDSYIIDRTADGTPISKTDQIRMCGNSVCPQVAAAIVAANYTDTSIEDTDEPVFAMVAAE
jgi:DNA (cytosine-5)-methyltransferase 1